MKLEPFNGVFGLPPSTYVSDEQIINSMPVAEITPCVPSLAVGLTLFRINVAWDRYTSVLSNLGFEIDRPLRIAFLADNFPTDSFTNDYGETFLQKMTDVASDGLAQLSQMSGTGNATQTVKEISSALEASGEAIGGTVGNVLGGVAGAGMKAATSLQGFQSQLRNSENKLGQIFGGGAQTIDKLLAGHRIDFPNLWRNSGYTPSYTVTVRLYNPNPGNSNSTEKYIIGPLAVLLALAVPRTEGGNTYTWPFFHKIRTNGIWWLDPGVITNISVIKGGDQQQIAYNQKLAIVDVRIDFASLYTSMILEEGDVNIEHRPTVRRYLDELRDNKPVYTREWLRINAGRRAGISSTATAREEIQGLQPNIVNEQVARRQAQTVQELTPQQRAQQEAIARQADLVAENRQNGFFGR